MNQEALDYFGKLLMERVRDQAIFDWDMILGGRAQSPHAIRVREETSTLSDSQKALLDRLVPQIVDTTLHHLLWTLEQEETVDLGVNTEKGYVSSLRKVSDGLTGEQFSWIPKYSNARYEPLL